MRFILDGMLGKLTRWLRMLGHDVKYYKDGDDNTLIRLALSEKRILLTRDFSLYQKAQKTGSEVFFIEKIDNEGNLAALAKRFGFFLEIDLNNSRCPKCNGVINIVSKKDVIDKIPTKTSIYYTDFWLCQSCGQVYWKGAHWKNIQSALNEAKNRLCDFVST